MDASETFGELLKRLRVGAGLTQEQLAIEAGVSVRTLQSWEIDHRCPVRNEFWQVLHVLGFQWAEAFSNTRSRSDRQKLNRLRGRPPKATTFAEAIEKRKRQRVRPRGKK